MLQQNQVCLNLSHHQTLMKSQNSQMLSCTLRQYFFTRELFKRFE